MGVRCLLGHDFGGREVERDRREDGEEVVVAYRTVETCERCGRRRVVSENKEIKPLRRDEEADAEPDEAETAPASSGGGEPAEAETAPASSGGAEPAEAETAPASSGGGEATPPEADTTASGDPDEAEPTPAGADTSLPAVEASPAGGGAADASDDAAIILDDADDAGESDAAAPDDETPAPETDAADGSWSAAGDEQTEAWSSGAADDGATAETDAAWPDADDDADDGFDASAPTTGGPGVDVDEASGAPTAAAWPDEGGVERDSNGTQFVRPEPTTPDRDAETEFHCGSCDATRPASSSSLRSGDVCPECRKGYLAERTVE